MKMLIRLLGSCICAIAFFYTPSVVAAGSQSIIPIPDISNKLRREAGPIVDKVDGEKSSSGTRGNQFAFKKGKAGFAAFSKSRGRFAFKKGKAGFAAFSKSRGRFAFKKGKAGFAAFSKSRGRFAFKKGKAGFAAFSKSRGRFAFKKGKAGFAAFSKSRGRFAFKKGKVGFAAFSKSRGTTPTTITIKDSADQTKAIETQKTSTTPTTIKLPLVIAPLTPQRGPGLSMTDQPNLYWYMSYWWKDNLGFTLNEFGTGKLIIEDSIRPSDCQKYPDVAKDEAKSDEGKDEAKSKDDLICHLRLADYGVRLKPNKDYEWFVFIVMDPEQRTSDWLSSAFVRYTQPSGQLTRRLNSTPLEQRFSIYKKNDFWYDAIDNLAAQIRQQPGLPENDPLRKKLKSWIEQEKMLNVAEFLVEGCAGCFHKLGVE
jgi:hypothetical protein